MYKQEGGTRAGDDVKVNKMKQQRERVRWVRRRWTRPNQSRERRRAENVKSQRPLELIPMKVCRSLGLASYLSTLIHRTHEVRLTGVPLPPIGLSRLLALDSLICPEMAVLFVNALLLATLWMMSSGAMTCRTRHHIRQFGRRSRVGGRTNLYLSEGGQEEIRRAISGGPRYDKQQRIHSIKRG